MALAAIQVEINAVNKTTSIEGLSWRSKLNGVGDCTFDVNDPAGLYIPDDGNSVNVFVGGPLAWRGEIVSVTVLFYNVISGVKCRIVAHDSNAKASREQFNGIIAAQSVEATIDFLTLNPTGKLYIQGIAKNVAQVTGPNLAAIGADFWNIDTLLNQICLLSGGMVWWVDETPQVELWFPGTKSSGVTISLSAGNLVDAEWTRHRFDYRNVQGVVYGPTGDYGVQEIFTGNGVAVSHAFEANVLAPPPTVLINPGAVTHPVGIFGVDVMTWTYDAALGAYGSLRNSGAALTGAQTLTAIHQSTGPNYLVVSDAAGIAAKGRWGKIVTAADTLNPADARILGQELIDLNLPIVRVPTIVTSATGIKVGYTVLLSITEIGLSETVFVQELSVEAHQAGDQIYPITTLKTWGGDYQKGTTEKLWSRIINGEDVGGGSASAGGAGSGSGGGTGGGTTTITGGNPAHWHFGGWKQVNAPSWRSVAGDGVAFDLPEGAEYGIVSGNYAGTWLLRIHLKTDGGVNGTVSARLFNETDAVAASAWTTGVTAAGFTYVGVVPTMTAGEKVYKVQLRVSGSAHATANISFWNATLETRL